jgi:hypothetical protein
MMLVGPLERRQAAWVGIRTTGTAIAGEHVRYVFLDRPVSAIPKPLASTDLYDGTPRPVASRMTRRRAKHQARGDNRRFGRGSRYFASFSILRFAAVPDVVFIGLLLGTDAAAGAGA